MRKLETLGVNAVSSSSRFACLTEILNALLRCNRECIVYSTDCMRGYMPQIVEVLADTVQVKKKSQSQYNFLSFVRSESPVSGRRHPTRESGHRKGANRLAYGSRHLVDGSPSRNCLWTRRIRAEPDLSPTQS